MPVISSWVAASTLRPTTTPSVAVTVATVLSRTPTSTSPLIPAVAVRSLHPQPVKRQRTSTHPRKLSPHLWLHPWLKTWVMKRHTSTTVATSSKNRFGPSSSQLTTNWPWNSLATRSWLPRRKLKGPNSPSKGVGSSIQGVL